MFQRSREDKIIDLLKNREYSTRELCDILDISISTLHRDLNELAKKDKIVKSHGGVIIKLDTLFANRLKENSDKKIIIAKKSLELINNGESLFLDNSSSCYYLAKEISKSELKALVIITNSSLIPGFFNKRNDIQVISTGGTYITDYECFAGSMTLTAIREFNANKFFFSVGSISIETGLSDTPNDQIVGDFKREMAIRAKERICIIDSTKFEKLSPRKFYSINDIDSIVTDSDVGEEIIKDFKRINKELIIADKSDYK